jgi:hypothetical protein
VRSTVVFGLPKEANVGYRIDCADGVTVRGDTMEELRTNAEQHVAERHQGEDIDFEAVMASAQEE